MSEKATILDHQDRWEHKSTVRSQPRRLIQQYEVEGYYFPIKLQELCKDPYVQSLGEEALHFILVQSFYKFLNDVAILENEVINKITLKIIFNRSPIKVDFNTRLNLMTVVVDESYHSYASLDYLKQVQEKTKITPIMMSSETAIAKAIRLTKLKLERKYRPFFELIALCIGENAITKEVFNLTSETGTNQFFKDIMHDHLLDERRHSGIFQRLLKEIWLQMEEDSKKAIGSLLPTFIKIFLSEETARHYNKKILIALKINPIIRKKILSDTALYHVTKDLVTVKNIIKCAQKAGILDHPPTKKVFSVENLLS